MTRLAATCGVRHADTPGRRPGSRLGGRCDDLTGHRWSHRGDGNLVTCGCPTRSPSFTTPVQPMARGAVLFGHAGLTPRALPTKERPTAQRTRFERRHIPFELFDVTGNGGPIHTELPGQGGLESPLPQPRARLRRSLHDGIPPELCPQPANGVVTPPARGTPAHFVPASVPTPVGCCGHVLPPFVARLCHAATKDSRLAQASQGGVRQHNIQNSRTPRFPKATWDDVLGAMEMAVKIADACLRRRRRIRRGRFVPLAPRARTCRLIVQD